MYRIQTNEIEFEPFEAFGSISAAISAAYELNPGMAGLWRNGSFTRPRNRPGGASCANHAT